MENQKVGSVTNKIAIITGGSRGLGRNTALNLARRGVDVIFTYRSKQAEADSCISEIESMEHSRLPVSVNLTSVVLNCRPAPRLQSTAL